MSRDAKRFPEIQVYPQPPSTYKIIEPYVDFVADLEADKVRYEVMHSEMTHRSQTAPSKSRKQHVNAPHPRPNSTKSPRNIKTAPTPPDSPLVRESLLTSTKKSTGPPIV
jgi:hypothetical protein